MKRKSVLSVVVAILALSTQSANANSVHSADESAFFSACASHYFGADWPEFKSCAVGFWYGKLAYNGGRADQAESTINSPGWPVMCPQGRESENPTCLATYEEFELYDEAAELAGEDYNYFLNEWTPPI
jgi:hypothetical protein